MSKALAGVARTRIKAIDAQVIRLNDKIDGLEAEKAELQQLVDAYSTAAPSDLSSMSSIEVEEV